MPIDYSKYPPNWKTEIRPAILKRAGNRCEFCGLPNGIIVHRRKETSYGDDKITCTKIVLTVAHLNHDVTDSRPENLAALCQKCHLAYDAGQHKATRKKNRFRDQPELF